MQLDLCGTGSHNHSQHNSEDTMNRTPLMTPTIEILGISDEVEDDVFEQ